jgi:hypothetical protein
MRLHFWLSRVRYSRTQPHHEGCNLLLEIALRLLQRRQVSFLGRHKTGNIDTAISGEAELHLTIDLFTVFDVNHR